MINLRVTRRKFVESLAIMKRSASPSALNRSPKKGKIENISWKFFGESSKGMQPVMYIDTPGMPGSTKVAAFDMDGTLITTKSGKTFPTGPTDWKFLNGKIRPKLNSLHQDGYKVVIFSNQAGMEKQKTKPKDIQDKISAIIKQIGFPIQAFIATGENVYRKPSTGLWDLMVKECNQKLSVDMEKSVFVGDAAGRPKAWAVGRKKDFSCSDRKFAANIGLKFYTPEEYFDNAKPYTKFEWGAINPSTVLNQSTNDDYENLPSKETEMVILVGYPASGKSTFSKRYLQKKGYVTINRDTLKTQEKCLQSAQEKLKNKISVVIDNTNPSKEARKPFLDIAKKIGVNVRCFLFETSFELCSHLNMYRQSQTSGKIRRIPAVGYNVYKKNFKEPEMSEGFTEICKIKFIPKFESEEDRKLFLNWT